MVMRSDAMGAIFAPMSGPVLVTTWPFGLAANERAWPDLARGGSALDAVEAVCRHVEADLTVDTVGTGGLPDRDGHVSLDALIMQSPGRIGAVCALRRHAEAISVARRVMEATPHVLLAGEGADDFAAEQGFQPSGLATDAAREKWSTWKREGEPVLSANESHDTVSVLALDAHGVLSGGCSTSGRAFKLPGRVGDSPLVGHGLYVHPEHGAAAATGSGELVMGLCGAFLAVEQMRRGATPLEALRVVLERAAEELELAPDDQIGLTALTPGGRFASAALRPGYATAIGHEGVQRVVDPELVLLPEA